MNVRDVRKKVVSSSSDIIVLEGPIVFFERRLRRPQKHIEWCFLPIESVFAAAKRLVRLQLK